MGMTDTNEDVLNQFWTGFGYDPNSDEIQNLDFIDALTYEPVSVHSKKSLPQNTGKINVSISVPSRPSRIIFSQVNLENRPQIGIYNLKGQLIRLLKIPEAGQRSVSIGWDGRNEKGARVKAGTYAVKLSDGKKSMSRKLVLLK